MSITDELRRYISERAGSGISIKCKSTIADIADSIDKAIASEYVKLPTDADGEPWHIGDRTDSGQTVKAMGLTRHGWHFVGTVNEIDPTIHRHHHAPTVEDVLREYAFQIGQSATDDDIVAEYAEKLRLADDGKGQ